MKYSIQTPDGDVFGIFDALPTTPPLSPEELATRLRKHLADDPVITRVEAAPLPVDDAEGGWVNKDRVVITMDRAKINGEYDLHTIHAAAGVISLMHELGVT